MRTRAEAIPMQRPTGGNITRGAGGTGGSGVNPEAGALPEQCLEAARRLCGIGMRPIPVLMRFDAAGSKIVTPLVSSWTPLRDGPAWTWKRTAYAFRKHWTSVNGLAVVLEPGHYCLDTDGPEQEAEVATWLLPECPTAMTLRGLHRHLWGPPGLMANDSVHLMPGVEVLARRLCIMPPSLGHYRWLAIPTGDKPEMPAFLIERVRAASDSGSRTAGLRPTNETGVPWTEPLTSLPPVTPAELDPWSKVLPNLKPDGTNGRRWRDFCPFHDDSSPSLVVYQRTQGRGRGRLYWIDLGACEGSVIRDSSGAPKLIADVRGHRRERHGGTLRELKSLLLRSRREQYDLADQAIDAVRAGTGMTEGLWIVLRELVTRARRHHLDLSDPNGIGLTMRDVAKLTGCEEVLPSASEPNGSLSSGGYYVYKNQKEARRLGFEVGGGSSLGRGRRGSPTRWRFPLAWVAPPQSSRERADLYPMPATTATDIGYRHDSKERRSGEAAPTVAPKETAMVNSAPPRRDGGSR